MSGLFGVLNVASRSLFVVQSSIQTAAHNVANVDTPGFSRQRVVLAPTAPLLTGAGALGTGVEQLTIQRITDVFVQAQLIQEEASGGSVSVQAQVLSAVEQILNEQSGGGISKPLSDFYSALSDLASATTPGAPIERQGVVAAAQALTATFQSLDGQLRDQQELVNGQVTSLVPRVNSLLDRIAGLNGAIVQQETQSPANDLRDERDRLVRDLAQLIDVDTFEGDGGLVVMIAGGWTAVDGVHSQSLDVMADTSNPFNPTFTRVVFDNGATQVDITDSIASGQLGGLLRSRDDLLPSAIRSLDVLAYNLTTSVNAVHSAGVGLDGSGGNFFVPLAGVEDAAGSLALEASILGNADAIAAGFTVGSGDNRNALDLAALRDAAQALALPGDPPGPATGPTRSLLNHAAAVLTDVGQQVVTLNAADAQHVRIKEVLEARRDQVSGVSLDEEMSNLVRLQAAFQANARVLGVIDELLRDVVSLI